MAYQIDPALWVREQLQVTPTPWQETFLRAPRGASILALTARQVGKTTTAAWAIAHTAVFHPGSLSVIACPAQRQSAEAVRRVRDCLFKVGAKLTSDNVYGLELNNGSRVLALPGSDDFDPRPDGRWLDRRRRGGPPHRKPDRGVAPDAGAPAATRGLPCCRPPGAGPIRSGWRGAATTRPGSGSKPPPIRSICSHQTYLAAERRSARARPPSSANISAFRRATRPVRSAGSLYERATQVRTPLVPPGPAFQPPPEAPAVPMPNPFQNLKPVGVAS